MALVPIITIVVQLYAPWDMSLKYMRLLEKGTFFDKMALPSLVTATLTRNCDVLLQTSWLLIMSITAMDSLLESVVDSDITKVDTVKIHIMCYILFVHGDQYAN